MFGERIFTLASDGVEAALPPPTPRGSRPNRLEQALALAEARIEDGDLAAAYVLIPLLPLLESFDDKQRCLALG